MAELWDKMAADPLASFAFASVAFAVLRRLSIWKTVRRFAFPVAISILVYRFQIHAPTLLDALNAALQPREYLPEGAVYLLRELAGFVVLVSLSNLVLCALSPIGKPIKTAIMDWGYSLVQDLPPVVAKVRQEGEKMEAALEHSLKPKTLGERNLQLPERGIDGNYLIGMMRGWAEEEHQKWMEGKVSGGVYHGEQEHLDILNAAFSAYSLANPLHADLWPSAMKYEGEVIAMTASMLNGGDTNVCGSMTSGGTESIILATKAHRDFYRTKGVTKPEIVACVSAHAAIDKACDMLGIRLIKIPMDPNTYQLNVRAMEAAIGPNTIMLYASAPTFPQGVIDDIEAVARLARFYNTGLHVDCCLGGFILPFAKKLGYPIPNFDFGVPGVTSMSVDTHKYGYALKGTSVVLYRNKELRHHQYFCYASWTGGLYATPTIAGSRSGGVIAATWASMMHLGEEGYLRHAKDIMESTQVIAAGVAEIEGLKLLGGTKAMIVCIASDDINIYALSDKMTKMGWSLNTLQKPACIHLCVTVCHVGHEEIFLADLREAFNAVKDSPPVDEKGDSSAAIYGATASMPAGPVNQLLRVYQDVVLKA